MKKTLSRLVVAVGVALMSWGALAEGDGAAASKEPALAPLPPVKKLNSIKLAPPSENEAIMLKQSRRAAVAVFCEQMRELIGPMSDEANAKFQAKWDKVMECPSTNVWAWIEKASPIVSELVQLKAAMNSAMVTYDEIYEEARFAQAFGTRDEAQAILGELSHVVAEMDVLSRRMKKLATALDELGEMPDPEEEMQENARRWKKSLQELKDIFGGPADKSPSVSAEDSNAADGKSEGGLWVLVGTQVQLAKNKKGCSYYGGELGYAQGWSVGSNPVQRVAFMSTCSRPPTLIEGGEEVKLDLTLTRQGGVDMELSASAGAGVKEASSVLRIGARSTDPKMKPVQEKGTANFTMPVGSKEGERQQLLYAACDGSTRWIYEWRTTNAPPASLKKKEIEKGWWVLVNTRVEVPRDEAAGSTTHSYSGNELEHTYSSESPIEYGAKRGRGTISTRCQRPPKIIEGDAPVRLEVTIDCTKPDPKTGWWGKASFSSSLDDMGTGSLPGGGNTISFSTWLPDSRDGKANTRETKFVTCKLGTISKGARPGQRRMLNYETNGIHTHWVYEWRDRDDIRPDMVDALLEAQSGGVEVETANTPEERAQLLEFHRENILWHRANLAHWEAELAKETNQDRRRQLEYWIIGERTDISHEEDLIRAQESGVFKHTRSPWDEMSQIQQREKTLKEMEEWDRNKRIRNRALAIADKLPLVERYTAQARVDKLLDEDPPNMEKLKKIGDALQKQYMGRLEFEQGMSESDLADREEALRRVQTLKTGCDIVLALGSMGAAGTASGVAKGVVYVYQAGTGYIEDGPAGAAKNVITMYSDVADVAWSTYDGYKEGGFWGAVQGGSVSVLMNYGLPMLLEKVDLTREISFSNKAKPDFKNAKPGLKGAKSGSAGAKVDPKNPKAGTKKGSSAKPRDINEMEFEIGKAKQDIADFNAKRKALADARRSKTSTQADIDAAEDALAHSVARLNASPTAKNMMKYDPKLKSVGSAFDKNLSVMKTRLELEMSMEMSIRGYGPQKLKEFRNASSKGTVGMDTDLGVVESPDLPFTRHGKPISKYEYQKACQEVLNEKWKSLYGQSAEKSWMNITTDVHPEAYRNAEILKYSKDADNMSDILSKMSRSDLQQAGDVTMYKAAEMTKLGAEGKIPRLQALQESARGTAKDIASKWNPMLDARIKELRALGSKATKSDLHNLKRFEAAKADLEEKAKILSEVGSGKVDYTEWDDKVRGATGGKGIVEFCQDLADLMKSFK